MLQGIKVLSFTHFLQGPSAVQMLADLGADVIKIESPTGAFERQWSGFDAFIDDVSVFFLLGNRNQRSLSINLRTNEGKEIIYKMVQDADVVVENFRPGVMDRLGFGYEKLKEMNPRLVYCSCTGYGSDGPYQQRPGQDMLLQAMSGLASISGGKDQPPTPVGTAAVDQHGAVLAAFGIVSALLSREKTGKGRKVESNLLNAAIDLQIEPLTYYLNKGPLWERSETGLATQFHQAPYGIYQTANGWIGISMTPIDKLISAFGTDSLAGYTNKDQMEKREEVNRIVVEEVKKRTTEDWYKIFEENGIWHAPVNGYEEIEKDPQVNWNKMIITAQHPDVGQIRLLNHPVRYEDYEIEVKKYPPRLGEHTNEVLEEYGFSQEEIESYLSKGITVNSMLSKGGK
ncbi:CaiB/BaiF CoA transferase family protein [Ammoniphilus resinae]|uniref:Crotonobetainyl-CoA:carnitine CoA-transferase CaiB-like acyl-CoA transferase n=1 Tax=Ammoniphilus resinae TaxID=861532 RepID=A0ABS4GQX4_9BACL|nr:CaiB/BaiF CoA-transferase family protein [Ammoniphilus resinae]MBP1932646.1 crotonobetainyl-CoA:carnitine CoA-transferase CaiB-like acyl-CoA transferase [Ammoniphilus resinae]